MGKNVFEEYTGQYSLSKTLRFELIPQGRTQEYIEANGILSEDEERAKNYKVVKKVIDEYHKQFMERALKTLELDKLKEYYDLSIMQQKNEKSLDQLRDLEKDMRKQVVKCIKADPEFSILDKRELITKKLPEFTANKAELEAIESFAKFTTYFKGFFENRNNMYSDEEKATAVAYRIVNQNLPKFIDNMRIFKMLMNTELCSDIMKLQEEMSEQLHNCTIESFFTLDAYSHTVTNSDINLYNTIIGGVSVSDKVKIKGINGYVNEFNQKHRKKENIKKLPLLKPLYKQILADKETLSFVEEQFENDGQVLENILVVVQEIDEAVLKEGANNSLERLLCNITSYDLDKIYIANGLPITNISNAVYKDWSVVKNSIAQQYDDENNPKGKKNEKYYDKKTKALEKRKSYSLGELNDLVEKHQGFEGKLETYFSSLGVSEEKNADGNPAANLFDVYREAYEAASYLLSLHENYHSKHGLASDKKNIAILKALLDAIKEIENFVKPLINNQAELEKDDNFYGELDEIYKTLSQITPLYNKVRNYVTKKPYSTEKVKLNFGNPEFLGGWPIKREIATSGLIFRDDDFYYLGVIAKGQGKCFKEYLVPEDNLDVFYKMEYLQAADPQKDVQNLMVIDGKTVKKNGRKEKTGIHAGENIVLEELKNTYLPTDINAIRRKKSYSKLSENFCKEDLTKFIEFYMQRTMEYFDQFKFDFREAEDYSDFGEFTDHVNTQAYQVRFVEISRKYINKLVAQGKLYLFKIYSKDFSPKSTGTPNLHTMYWKMLFDENNLANPVYKLNGEAEVFYRKSSIKQENIVCHKANESIPKKNLEARLRGEKSLFEYDLIKDKRYTVDKYQFHVPITMNFCAEGRTNLNDMVLESIRKNSNINAIGIDRGERNLLYISVVSPEGKILHQQSLNIIENTDKKGNVHRIDYHALLDDREKTMDKERKSWSSISTIKELKEGYLSQAIHVITNLMIEYNAIVVLEDLNFGFMNGRKKVGKQVYQKFEKMLIDKLNYLVDKKLNPNELGGALHAYQLTNQFQSFSTLGKQSGFLFYIPAWNTSKLDPTTGFVNLLYPKYTSKEEAKAYIRKFDSIRYNEEEKYFEFAFDYKNFTDKATGTKTDWTICSYGDRVISERNPKNNNEWDSVEVDITDRIMKLLQTYGIALSGDNMVDVICSCNDKKFYDEFMKDIRYVLQIRNSVINSDIDYMLSPVKNEHGEFFDTRKYDENNAAYNYFPKDADANGAYNIARKGLWAMERIRESEDGKVKLAISNKEWLCFAQENTI